MKKQLLKQILIILSLLGFLQLSFASEAGKSSIMTEKLQDQ